MGTVTSKQFVDAASAYVKKALAKADKNGDGVITQTEAKKLPRDLRDNYGEFSTLFPNGVSTDVFKNYFLNTIKAAVGNKRKLDITDQGRFADVVRDNFLKFYMSQQPKVEAVVDGKKVVSRDTTDEETINAHLVRFGGTADEYKKAVSSALGAVLNSRHSYEGLHYQLEQEGVPPAKIQSEVNRQMREGHLSLLDVNSNGDTSYYPSEYWTFFVHSEAQRNSGKGFYVHVYRQDVSETELSSRD